MVTLLACFYGFLLPPSPTIVNARGSREVSHQLTMWNSSNDRFAVGDRVHAKDHMGWVSAVLVRQYADGRWDAMTDDRINLCGLTPQQLRLEPSYPSVSDDLSSTLVDPWDDGAARGAALQPSQPAQSQAPPPAAPKHKFIEGARVQSDYCGLGYYHDATIKGLNPDGTYAVLYDDGLTEERVPPNRINYGGAGGGSGRDDGKWSAPPPRDSSSSSGASGQHAQKGREQRRRRISAPPSDGVLREGSKAQGNWGGLGYWHPCTIQAVLPGGGGFRLLYEDGFEEDAPAECVKPLAPREGRGGGMVFSGGSGGCFSDVPTLDVGGGGGGGVCGGGGFGAAAVAASSRRGDGGSEYSSDMGSGRDPLDVMNGGGGGGGGRRDSNTPLAPRRRRASGVHEAEKVRKQVEQERKARLEVFKLKPEDKRWAEQHGLTGERGLFQGMIARYRLGAPPRDSLAPAALSTSDAPIAVFVRKRPLLPDELKGGAFDVVTPHSAEVSTSLVMHEPKTMVDLSKAMDNHTYRFDGVFGEGSTNEQIFDGALRPMVDFLFSTRGGHGTCFAYGQTGSGKTVTMEGLGRASPSEGNRQGLYAHVAHAIFARAAATGGAPLVVKCGFFEIYRGKCFDLLNRKRKIEVMEDERGQQCLVGLSWAELPSAEALLQLLASTERTTRATAQNEQSSRSHAILQISVAEPAAHAHQSDLERFRLSLVDLAGSEWAAKAQSDDRGNRLDGAEINKSLLCLKECIRALGAHGAHVPFRGSKLTQVLKDSFVGAMSRTVMIANIAPGNTCCEHSMNTLRYAQRVREWTASNAPPPAAAAPPAAARRRAAVGRRRRRRASNGWAGERRGGGARGGGRRRRQRRAPSSALPPPPSTAPPAGESRRGGLGSGRGGPPPSLPAPPATGGSSRGASRHASKTPSRAASPPGRPRCGRAPSRWPRRASTRRRRRTSRARCGGARSSSGRRRRRSCCSRRRRPSSPRTRRRSHSPRRCCRRSSA